MNKTKIEWADTVWNPVTGCTKVSEGCRNCYAERMSKRLTGRYGYPSDDPFRVTLHPEKLDEPLKWKKTRRVFVNSMGDLFHDDVPYDFICDVFARMGFAKQHIFLILTKRPKRILELFKRYESSAWPLPNVWLGVSVENQQAADERIPILLQIPAKVKFISAEPLLGEINIQQINDQNTLLFPLAGQFITDGMNEPISLKHGGIDWVITGGETGPGARPIHPDWVRSLRDQCQTAGVPFFFKSWGEFIQVGECMNESDDNKFYNMYNVRRVNHEGGMGFHGAGAIYMQRVGKKKSGNILDGSIFQEFPEVK